MRSDSNFNAKTSVPLLSSFRKMPLSLPERSRCENPLSSHLRWITFGRLLVRLFGEIVMLETFRKGEKVMQTWKVILPWSALFTFRGSPKIPEVHSQISVKLITISGSSLRRAIESNNAEGNIYFQYVEKGSRGHHVPVQNSAIGYLEHRKGVVCGKSCNLERRTGDPSPIKF